MYGRRRTPTTRNERDRAGSSANERQRIRRHQSPSTPQTLRTSAVRSPPTPPFVPARSRRSRSLIMYLVGLGSVLLPHHNRLVPQQLGELDRSLFFGKRELFVDRPVIEVPVLESVFHRSRVKYFLDTG